MYRSNRRLSNRNRRIVRNKRRPRNNIFKRRVYNIRNSTTHKPRKSGYNNLALSFARRFIAYPSSGAKPSPDKPAPKSAWWLDKLQWFGSLALQLIGIFIAAVDDEKDAPSFAITGAGTAIMISPSTFLQSTSIANNSQGRVMVPFEQAKLLWVKATVTPVVDASVVGGSYACALIPLDEDQSIADVPTDFERICLQPGSVIRPMSKPVSVSWSPTLQEHSFRWHRIGDTGEHKVHLCAFVIAFSDMALASADKGGTGSHEYNPGKSGFELYFDGQISVRQPGVSIFRPTIEHSDPTVVKILRYGETHYGRFSDVKWKHGFGSIKKEAIIEKIIDRERSDSLDLDDLTIE